MDNRQLLFQTVADVFQIDVASVNDATSPDTVPSWDSLAVVNLVTELQAAFKVEFDILEIADFRNVALIKTILNAKGVSF